jgi:hypothetical protein
MVTKIGVVVVYVCGRWLRTAAKLNNQRGNAYLLPCPTPNPLRFHRVPALKSLIPESPAPPRPSAAKAVILLGNLLYCV